MMKRTTYICLLLTLLASPLLAQQAQLKFNVDKKFKIVQFTDLHYAVSRADVSEAALECIRMVLDTEKPDLVIFTGDLLYSKPAAEGLKRVTQPVTDRKIPFAVTWGNHDDEQGTSRSELQSIIEQIPGNIGKKTPGIPGESNFALAIQTSDKKTEAAILYCFDSNSYSSIPRIKGYGWIHPEQIRWYTSTSRQFTARNGGKPLPSLAFFHIPLPEYNLAASEEDARLTGYRWEKACAPELNTGLYTAMLEADDVRGVFVGHDHDNDFVTDWKGILLGYGRFSGGNTEYNNLPEGNGARVICLTEGSTDFATWIRLRTGEKIQSVQYNRFVKPVKK